MFDSGKNRRAKKYQVQSGGSRQELHPLFLAHLFARSIFCREFPSSIHTLSKHLL
jgi:hypothetical protein